MFAVTVLWLLPVVFMFHDFEEIILSGPWLRKNAVMLQGRFPKLMGRVTPHLQSLSTSAFALAVAEEFILIALVTFMAAEQGWFQIWVGLLVAFFIHLLIHIGQSLVLRAYTPMVLTSVLSVVYCVFALNYFRAALVWPDTFIWSVIAFIVMIINLLFVHWLAGKFDGWLRVYFAEAGEG